ncbi:hypothetical protein [Kitasatospora sp. NPDC058046]|uniref:hypothetical protein n=1 Tax=Kitasatospora sp. NPDC058046 TaxID=3346312 RepID=UPI0036DE511E
MNPDFLPPLSTVLRTLGEYAADHEVNDSTLGSIAADLDRAQALVASARGTGRTTTCGRHPNGPYDPTADNKCLLCGAASRTPAAPPPAGVTPEIVLAEVDAHGEEAAAARYGARALARALAVRTRQPNETRAPAVAR